ncbi:MAG TPA: type I-U CRISPR-associated protein Csb2 [Bryobacteraceae bacterium]|nr:type I-U CRISPR-associated protein Csb2 [Bryobacteraceae bacterium]
MASHFCLSVRFLDTAFHGRGDGGAGEWPPSPLRVFQALVAAAARKNGGTLSPGVQSALRWLEGRMGAPVVIAPRAEAGSGYRLSVPNNAMDIVAKAWAAGNDSNSGDANPATHRTMKSVRPMLLEGEATHYVWRLPDPASEEVLGHVQGLSEAAADIVALGWGLDLAIGHGRVLSDDEVEGLEGVRWLPAEVTGANGLRTPAEGTTEDLVRHHEHFVRRLAGEGFVPPPPLSTYARVEYRTASDPPARPFAAFQLLQPDASGRRPFDTARRGLTVAGMMRGAVKEAAKRSGWPESKIASFVLGHGEPNTGGEHVTVGPRRFAYLPAPSIEFRGDAGAFTGSVRRAILTTFSSGCEEEIAWAQRMLGGQELMDQDTKQATALLSLIPANDSVVRRYCEPAAVWATVTPVVLPGYDDRKHYRRRMQSEMDAEEQRELLERLDGRMDGLLRKAIRQAGLSAELAENAEIDWRKSGFWPGTELADRYGVPAHLKKFPRYHVKVRWRDREGKEVKLRGPLCLGGGRFCGLGLFAAV